MIAFHDIWPQTKPRMTQRDRWKKRLCVLEYNRYKDELRLKRVTLPASGHVVFLMPMPASWSDAKRARHAGQPHQQTPDTDNLLKGLMDAVFKQDAHVWDMRGTKIWWTAPGLLIADRQIPVRLPFNPWGAMQAIQLLDAVSVRLISQAPAADAPEAPAVS